MDPRMTDLEQLTVLDPARGREPSAPEWARSEAMVDRITAGRRPRPMRRTLVVVAAAAAVGVVGAVTLPSLLRSTAETAYASWTPAPGSLTGEQVLTELVRQARDKRMAVVLVTHDVRVAAYADREVVLRDGAVDPTGLGVGIGS